MSKDLTEFYISINNHIEYHNDGKKELKYDKLTRGLAGKTVCVTTCLNYFKVPFDSYHYTHSKSNVQAYKNVLRRHWSVRSRKSEFKVSKFPTMTQLRSMMKKSNYTDNDKFIVSGFQSKSAHLMVLNGNGETIIDTAKGKKWRIRDVAIVEAK